MLSNQEIIEGLKKKDRSILSQAITLIESHKRDHQEQARELIEMILPLTGNTKRIGISGTPGVGKSTFIEAFGKYLVEKKHRVAVLAVDPSSYLSGGSILGDKTRMPYLSSHENSYVRPSPNNKSLGGVNKASKESMLLCEAFGFDYIIVETVGVGQSEVTVSKLVDHFMLLMQPAAGDELQGIKRGILELADSVIVNKADGDLLPKAKIAKTELESSLGILRKEEVPILLCSALEKLGLDEVYNSVNEYFSDTERLKSKRLYQEESWFYSLLEYELLERVKGKTKLKEIAADIKKSVPTRIKEALKELKI